MNKLTLASATLLFSARALVACSSEQFVTARADAGAGSDAPLTDASAAWVPCTKRQPSTGAKFCDDFDDPRVAFGGRWQGTARQTNGTVSIGPSTLSAPNLFVSAVDASTTSFALASLRHAVGTVGGDSMHLRFAMRPELVGTGGAGGYLVLAAAHFDDAVCATQTNGTKGRRLVLAVSPSTGRLSVSLVGFAAECSDAGTDYVTHETSVDLVGGPAPYPWSDYDLTIARRTCVGAPPGTPSFEVRRDGQVIACEALGVDPFTKTKTLTIELGLLTGGWTASAFHFDNLELEVE